MILVVISKPTVYYYHIRIKLLFHNSIASITEEDLFLIFPGI